MKKYVILVSLFLGLNVHADSMDQLASALASLSSSAPAVKTQFSEAELKNIYEGIKLTLVIQYKDDTYQKNYATYKGFTEDIFLQTAEAFITKSQEILKNAAWLAGGTPDYLFVRKLVLPADSVIEFRGDLHGDALSLIRWLDSLRDQGWFDKDNPFKLAKKGHYLAFLGDYTDRGHYGAECMFIIMQLFLHNPDNVLIVRGNHEDDSIVDTYGFVTVRNDWGMKVGNGELQEKFGKDFDYDGATASSKLKTILNVYTYMPVALFLGCENGNGGTDFIQCCHGGMEPGYNPQDLLEDARKDLYQRLSATIDEKRKAACALEKDMNVGVACSCAKAACKVNGFQWNDFDFKNESPLNDVTPNKRGSHDFFLMNTTEMLKVATKKGSKNNVWAVFRAHQHTGETVPHILEYGNGIYKLWHGPVKPGDNVLKGFKHFIQWSGTAGAAVPIEKYSVWTFNVAPRAGYERYAPKLFNYDTVARLALKPGFDNWTLHPRQIKVL